jgi:hypothetical protein
MMIINHLHTPLSKSDSGNGTSMASRWGWYNVKEGRERFLMMSPGLSLMRNEAIHPLSIHFE